MILAPAIPVSDAVDTLVTIRLIGTLDHVLVESMNDVCARLSVSGRRTLIVRVRDLVAMRDDSLDGLLAALNAFRAAGNRVVIDSTPTWRKIVRGLTPQFEESTRSYSLRARRQIIICHSVDKRAGAA